MQPIVLIAIFGAIVLVSLLASPRRASIEGFFGGTGEHGKATTLWVLV